MLDALALKARFFVAGSSSCGRLQFVQAGIKDIGLVPTLASMLKIVFPAA